MFLTKAGDEGAASSHGFTRQNKKPAELTHIYDPATFVVTVFKQISLHM